ncbi:Mor transcription activator family protein [methanotrophic endosymbiont of Bathymodiolus puteoserpentis (Logatchev)]|jgi:Mor family transcriptional regulator|uniref:Mor transcription activator family protein n=1 Tax=methanotrophic endosymbiont of Bathymodiolus puteoserpentis (Logatchev) TaxID=343235 RepID=UPI0013C858FE|nr:Mor transcription activator family protein [methanotrophic endosymbiont of Bathymodiolus puteoserpentis (Logatchev)]SHE19272.1 putative bacteriophage transcriptional regulator [methanotrophic endosymbiont of Bathymodiolus puteoserpentis (Logatchev)]
MATQELPEVIEHIPEIIQELPEIIQDIYAYSLESIKNNPAISDKDAANIALDIAQSTRHRWGGILVYIPKGDALDTKNKKQNIRHDFNGSNHIDLARKYKVSVQSIYKTVKTEASKK